MRPLVPTGRMPFARVRFPLGRKSGPRPIDTGTISDSATTRLRESARGAPNESESLRAEALGETDRGRSGRPLRLNHHGFTDGDPGRKINPVLRFPSFRNCKIRAIDDLRHGVVRKFCVVDSPSAPPS